MQDYFLKELVTFSDYEYKLFNQKLIPNINPNSIIGVRVPHIRKLAKTLFKGNADNCLFFLNELPHSYFEQNALHAFFIEQLKSFDDAIIQTEKFLPFIDNWAICDLFRPKIFCQNKPLLLKSIKKWIKSNHCYTVRFSIGMLLSYFLDESFNPEYLKWVSAIHSDEYYVKMMIAWYFSTAIVKQYDESIPYLEYQKLGKWTHNKTIQKAIESRKVPIATKEFLKSLKLK